MGYDAQVSKSFMKNITVGKALIHLETIISLEQM